MNWSLNTDTATWEKKDMNKDAISRCELFNRLATLPAPAEANKFKAEVYKIIQEMETEDRPQGEWIDAEIPLESGGSMSIQVCNLCKTFYPLAYTGGGHRFCPHCGARMKGADDERSR